MKKKNEQKKCTQECTHTQQHSEYNLEVEALAVLERVASAVAFHEIPWPG